MPIYCVRTGLNYSEFAVVEGKECFNTEKSIKHIVRKLSRYLVDCSRRRSTPVGLFPASCDAGGAHCLDVWKSLVSSVGNQLIRR